MDIVTRAEIETERSAATILVWVETALDRYDVQPRHVIVEARTGKLFHKELAQEAFPIALFATNYFERSDEVWITHVLGNQQFDAAVDDRRGAPGPVRYIEVTHGAFDADDARRMELLSAQGHAPSYGPVIAEGPRSARTRLEATLEAQDHLELRADHIERARQAVTRKAAKQYAPGTALVIMVDDRGPFGDDEDRDKLARTAQAEFVPLVNRREFPILAFVGTSGLFIGIPLQTDL